MHFSLRSKRHSPKPRILLSEAFQFSHKKTMNNLCFCSTLLWMDQLIRGHPVLYNHKVLVISETEMRESQGQMQREIWRRSTGGFEEGRGPWAKDAGAPGSWSKWERGFSPGSTRWSEVLPIPWFDPISISSVRSISDFWPREMLKNNKCVFLIHWICCNFLQQ